MRSVVLFLLGLAISHKVDTRVDPNCPDFELNGVCKEVCVEETFTCITNCDTTDSECITTCLRAETTCVDQCPCGADCYSGCQGCDNPICECSDVTQNENWNNCLDINGQSLARCIYNCNDNESCEADCVGQFKAKTSDCPCEENCKAGCPCDSYECNDFTTTPVSTTTAAATTTTAEPAKEAVLLLSTQGSSNVPMVIDFEGNVDADTVFTYETDTEVYASCAATLHDEFWVIGGYNKKRQLSKIENCNLSKVGELDFDYYYGGCNTFSFGILLCFSESDTQTCHSFDGKLFRTEPSSNYPHTHVNVLGVYKRHPFVTGSEGPNNRKTEILDYQSKQWNVVADYPFSSGDHYISYYATTSTEESVYIIGGWTSDYSTGYKTPIIAEYKNDVWYNVGSLNQSRHAHGAITSGSFTMVIGGSSTDSQPLQFVCLTEIWEIETLENRIVAPTLTREHYREVGLFLVDKGYCKKT